MPKSELSVVIITKNEEDKIARCLESVRWADEVVVVDDLSEDKTVEICQRYGAKVISHKSDGNFDRQRNIGIDSASGDWILQMDADEIIGAGLKKAIQKAIKDNPDCAAFKFKRKNYFLGHFMRYGGCYDTYFTKLFRRNLARYTGHSVHEILQANGEIRILDEDIDHYPFNSIAQFVQRQNFYSSVEAKVLYEDIGIVDERHLRYQMLKRPFKMFWKLYIKKKGFKDGRYGLVFAVLNSWKHFLIWAKYWEIVKDKR